MSNAAPNPLLAAWDEKAWAYANLKAAKERGLTQAADLNQGAADLIGLTPEQRTERSANKKLRFVVISEWSRTKLKNKGLLINTNPGNGTWALTPKGETLDCATYESFLAGFNRPEPTSDMNYISQYEISNALLKALFRKGTAPGSAKTTTSLIFQTLAYHVATVAAKTGYLEIGARQSGTTAIKDAYTKMVSDNPLEPKAKRYISALGTDQGDSYLISTNKDAADALSSNFISHVKGSSKDYEDFKYNADSNRLTVTAELTSFKEAIGSLEDSAIIPLIILALRSYDFPNETAPLLVTRELLASKFGAAGEALHEKIPAGMQAVIQSFQPGIATLTAAKVKSGDVSEKMNDEQRLICALAAKPFVILAGGTGTGKTKSAIETVKKLCKPTAAGKASDQFEVVAVGADWTDTRPLLGYVNLLIENGPAYSAPAALKLILRAHKNPGLPYFLILDEMNLSHVERYFSDFLSLMEAKKIDKSAAAIKLHSQTGDMKAAEAGATDVPAEIPWPANLYVIGTVNIDETTHMFSPKVLDRAHVIEYKVEWDSNPDQGDNGHTIVRGLDQMVAPKSEDAVSSTCHWDLNGILVKPAEDRLRGIDEKEAMAKSIEPIGKLWEELRGTRFAFSHRTAQEAIGYILIASNLAKTHREIVGAPSTEHLIDLAVLQKILPKINGSADVLTRRAKDTSPQPGKTMNQSGPLLTKLAEICEKLPLSSAKLRSMQATLDTEHFVSFIQ